MTFINNNSSSGCFLEFAIIFKNTGVSKFCSKCANSAWLPRLHFQNIYGARKYIMKKEMNIYGNLEVG